jgi:hypothetical protein
VSQQRAGVLSHAALGVLLSSTASAEGIGQLVWSLKKPKCHQGVLEVHTSIPGFERGQLRIYFVDMAASEPSLQYLTGGVSIRRLDVNGDHRSWVNKTHKHTYDPTSGRDSAYLPPDIPDVPLGPTVAAGTYQVIFGAFAKECFVSLPDGYWVEP